MEHDHDEKISERIVLTLTFTLMSIITVTGNLHIIYSILTVKKLQTVANSFLLSLAIADFTVGAVVMPTSIVTTIANQWLGGAPGVMCDLSAFVDNVTLTMSMWSLGLLAIERFYLMVYPFKYCSYITTKSATSLICISWFVVAMISVCPMLGWGQYGYTSTYCCGIAPVEESPGSYYFLFFCIAAFLPPIAVGCGSYLAILRVLIRQRAPKVYSSGVGITKRTDLEKRENMVACLSVFICLVLMICFNVPTVVIGLCFWAGHHVNVPEGISLVFHIMWYAKSTANPLIFGLLNRVFRRELLKYKVFKMCKFDMGEEDFHDTRGMSFTLSKGA